MRVFARSNVQARYKADLADPPKKKKEPKNTLMACFAKAREKQSAKKEVPVASQKSIDSLFDPNRAVTPSNPDEGKNSVKSQQPKSTSSDGVASEASSQRSK